MAELGAIAAIVQVADAGLRLSTTLFTFSETVAKADKAVAAISKDVSLTSVVLRELADDLKKNIDSQEHSTAALDSAVAVVNECSEVFQETETLLVEKFPTLSSPSNIKEYRVRAALERFKWPYLQPKVRLLQGNLERLKSSLLVILHVISLARSMQIQPSSVDERYKTMIKDLIEKNENHVRRYEKLKHSTGDISATDTRGIATHIATQKSKLMVNMQREMSQNIPKANQGHDHETKLDNLDHFVALFDRLQQEATTPSYRIGSRSRSRIEKDISDARNREATYLGLFHGEAVMKGAWNTPDQKKSLVTPSIEDPGIQQLNPSEATTDQPLADTGEDDQSTAQVPEPPHSQHEPGGVLKQQLIPLRYRRRRFSRWLRRKYRLQLPWLENPLHRREALMANRDIRDIRVVEEAGFGGSSQPPHSSSVVFAGPSTADKKLNELLRLWTPVAIPSIAEKSQKTG